MLFSIDMWNPNIQQAHLHLVMYVLNVANMGTTSQTVQDQG